MRPFAVRAFLRGEETETGWSVAHLYERRRPMVLQEWGAIERLYTYCLSSF
jgi:hypothetical protein